MLSFDLQLRTTKARQTNFELPCLVSLSFTNGLDASTCLRCRYASFVPLHTLWTQYISELLKNCQDREARLLAADYHGCILTISQAANPIHAGLTGLVIKDSAHSFTLVTQADRTYHVLKHKSVFSFKVGSNSKVTLLGTNLQRERSRP